MAAPATGGGGAVGPADVEKVLSSLSLSPLEIMEHGQIPPWTPANELMDLHIRRQIPKKLEKRPKHIWLYWSSFFGHQLVPTLMEENLFISLLFRVMLLEKYKLAHISGTFPPEYRFDQFIPGSERSEGGGTTTLVTT